MSPLVMREKFESKQTLNVFKKINTVPKATKFYNSNSIFVSPIPIFSLGGNISVYTPIHGTNMKKYFIHVIFKEKNADSGGKWTHLRPFLP